MAQIKHRISADASGFSDTIRDVNESLDGTTKAEKGAEKGAEGLRKSTVLLGGALAATTALVAKGIAAAIAQGDAYGKMSERTGIAVETLSSFKLALENSDTSLGSLASGLSTLSKGMLDAVLKGTGPAADGLAVLGISATDASGQLRKSEDVLTDVSRAFAGMTNGTEKAALAAKLFGGAGRDLIPFLNLGASGLATLQDKSEALGQVWDDKTSQAAEDFGDSLNVLKTAGNGVFQQAAKFWVPTLAGIAKGFENATLAALGYRSESSKTTDLQDRLADEQEATRALKVATEQLTKVRKDGYGVSVVGGKLQLASAASALKAAWAEVEARTAALEQARLAIVAEEEETKTIEANKAAKEAAAKADKDAAADKAAADKAAQAAAAKADKAAAAAAARAAEAQKQEEEAAAAAASRAAEAQKREEAVAAARKANADALEDLAGMSRDVGIAMLEGTEQLEAERQRDFDAEMGRIEDLVTAQTSAAELTEDEKGAVLEAAAEARLALEEQFQADIAKIRDDARKREDDAEEAARDARISDLRDILSASSEVFGAIGNLVDTVLQVRVDAAAEGTQAEKDALREQWEAQAAIAILQAAIAVPVAILSAMQVPGGVGIALGIIAGVMAGVALAATIAAAAKGPSFHDGGMVGDELQATVRRGEVVLPNPTVRAMGGPEGVASVAAGGGGAQSFTIVQKLDHRVLNAQIHRAIQQTGSPLDSGLRRTNPRGTGRRNAFLPRT